MRALRFDRFGKPEALRARNQPPRWVRRAVRRWDAGCTLRRFRVHACFRLRSALPHHS